MRWLYQHWLQILLHTSTFRDYWNVYLSSVQCGGWCLRPKYLPISPQEHFDRSCDAVVLFHLNTMAVVGLGVSSAETNLQYTRLNLMTPTCDLKDVHPFGERRGSVNELPLVQPVTMRGSLYLLKKKAEVDIDLCKQTMNEWNQREFHVFWWRICLTFLLTSFRRIHPPGRSVQVWTNF